MRVDLRLVLNIIVVVMVAFCFGLYVGHYVTSAQLKGSDCAEVKEALADMTIHTHKVELENKQMREDLRALLTDIKKAKNLNEIKTKYRL